MSPLSIFYHVVSHLESRYTDLARGKMLSAPAIEYKGRAFAFCHRDTMIIKYRDAVELENKGIRATQEYKPFKNMVSFSEWREVPFYYQDDWPELAEMALGALKAEID